MRPPASGKPFERAGSARGGTIVLTSGELLNGQREILIRHGDEHSRLRRTRLDKLILTK